jgi:hypothetical protein
MVFFANATTTHAANTKYNIWLLVLVVLVLMNRLCSGSGSPNLHIIVQHCPKIQCSSSVLMPLKLFNLQMEQMI